MKYTHTDFTLHIPVMDQVIQTVLQHKINHHLMYMYMYYETRLYVMITFNNKFCFIVTSCLGITCTVWEPNIVN